jgi:hypothetical protein
MRKEAEVAARKNGGGERDWNRQDASAPYGQKIEERIKAEMPITIREGGTR